MSDLPKSIRINEEGPREGFQIEPGPITTARKIELINALAETGLHHMQIVSFVNPKRVPGQADAEAVIGRLGCASRLVDISPMVDAYFGDAAGEAAGEAAAPVAVEGSRSALMCCLTSDAMSEFGSMSRTFCQAALAATSASGCRHTSVPSAARLIRVQQPIDSHADGTWMNMIFAVAPCW